MRYVLIMAGGSGKRLWPLSRQDMPKQLLKVVGGKSLLRLAYERVSGLVPAEQVLVCTGADYADVVAGDLPEVPAANILGEPRGPGLAQRGGLAGGGAAGPGPRRGRGGGHRGPDHAPGDAFQAALEEGFAVAESCPDVAGHLRRGPDLGAHRVRLPAARRRAARPPDVEPVQAFREKPDRATAEAYLASGEYWWNSGMFVWRAATLLQQLRAAAARDARRGDSSSPGSPSGWPRSTRRLLKISVDYAVMEPVSQAGEPPVWSRSGCRSPGTTSAGSPRWASSCRATSGQRDPGGRACWSTRGTTW